MRLLRTTVVRNAESSLEMRRPVYGSPKEISGDGLVGCRFYTRLGVEGKCARCGSSDADRGGKTGRSKGWRGQESGESTGQGVDYERTAADLNGQHARRLDALTDGKQGCRFRQTAAIRSLAAGSFPPCSTWRKAYEDADRAFRSAMKYDHEDRWTSEDLAVSSQMRWG